MSTAAASLLLAGCGGAHAVAGGGSTLPPTQPSASSAPAPTQSPARSPAPRCGASTAALRGDSVELTGVQFVSGSTGWAVGSDRILGTDDGGRHWVTEYRSPAAAQLATVDFTDARHGWVTGASTILATADGGAHWQVLPEPCPVLRTVHFISSAVGFAVAGGSLAGGSLPFPGVPAADGVLLATTDGGLRWHRLAAPASVQSECFDSPEQGWLGAGGRIYGTVDGGRSWTLAVQGARYRPGPPGVAVLAEVECAGNGAAWAELIGPGAAMNHVPHIGYHTFGTTWQPIFAEQYTGHPGVRVQAASPGPEPGPFSAVSPSVAVFIDSCAPCEQPGTPPPGSTVQGSAPLDLALNGGAILRSRGPVSGLAVADAAAFISPDEGWVVGTQTTYPASGSTAGIRTLSRIMQTADGGRTWQVQYTLAP